MTPARLFTGATLLSTLLLGGCPEGASPFLDPAAHGSLWREVGEGELSAERIAFRREIEKKIAGRYRIAQARDLLVLKDGDIWDKWRHFTGDPLEQERGCSRVVPDPVGLGITSGVWSCPELPGGRLVAIHLSRQHKDNAGHPLLTYLLLEPVQQTAR